MLCFAWLPNIQYMITIKFIHMQASTERKSEAPQHFHHRLITQNPQTPQKRSTTHQRREPALQITVVQKRQRGTWWKKCRVSPQKVMAQTEERLRGFFTGTEKARRWGLCASATASSSLRQSLWSTLAVAMLRIPSGILLLVQVQQVSCDGGCSFLGFSMNIVISSAKYVFSQERKRSSFPSSSCRLS